MTNLRGQTTLAVLALIAALALPARGQDGELTPGKADPDGLTMEGVRSAMPEYFHVGGSGRVQPNDIPDIFGPGAVLNVGNIYMKITNWGHVGNLFTQFSSDPSAQWPGASGIEYLSSIRLSVGAVNPLASDPLSLRRVSYLLEWRPATLQPEDKIYRAYDGVINGQRYFNDDGDGPDRVGNFGPDYIDEDFLDGRDNDGDGKVDEDFGALGQQMYSLVVRDDTPQAIAASAAEKHVPLGLECRQLAWAYSIPGFTDFNVIEYNIYNRSGHVLDSLYIGWLVDIDAGPLAVSNFYQDDFDLPAYPHGEFKIPLDLQDRRRQANHLPELDGQRLDATHIIAPGEPLCRDLKIRINGFSDADDDGDDGRTPGIPSFLLIDHTIDPLGTTGPWRVGFRAFRSFISGTPYVQGGNPTTDQQKYEFMSSKENVAVSEKPSDDPADPAVNGWITALPGDQKGDYVQWCSVGPWLSVASGAHVSATIAFGIRTGRYADALKYQIAYDTYWEDRDKQLKRVSMSDLQRSFLSLDNAISAQVAFEGIYELRNTYPQTNNHGRETGKIGALGTIATPVTEPACEARGSEARTEFVDSNQYRWFDMDCDYCTGVFVPSEGGGWFHKVWNAEAPPPNPNTNLAAKYNYSDNPDRLVIAAGDRMVTLAWDNLSEYTPDPKSRWFDCRGYKLWKVANWVRPVGSPGPGEDDWALIGEFRKFDYRASNGAPIPDNRYRAANGDTLCPSMYIPNWLDPATGVRGPATVPVCLQRGDLWDRQTGTVIRPTDLGCEAAGDSCARGTGCRAGADPCIPDTVIRYPVGRYRFVDRDVKNGFMYFYSVTAFDSTGVGSSKAELSGRRSGVEAEGVVPQFGTRTGKSVWVVPNPYRGYANVAQRPSSWDLVPNATDPTGTHVDFLGLPPGDWTIRIYTVSGDLVQTIRSTDSVNESLRPHILDAQGVSRPGYNRQQDNPSDGQARWNLISRNGQDIVSGIYIFTVDSGQGTQRGKFVVIR